MTFCLDATFIKPEKGKEISNAIILFHGYGGDGKDISMLSHNWKRYMPNTIFICPNGHESCSINPSGFQWFDLTKDNKNYILEETLKAEKKINQFLKEVKKEFNLENKKICLSGFSQGCMMSINIGLTSIEPYCCIVGFSGKIIDTEDLKIRKKNSSDILLIHGEHDDIVSPTHLLESKDFLLRNDVRIETHLIKNTGHHIPIEASSIALNYILKKINN
tara:strand:+ start:562 stop:1218 length:657 start_codon:yes stop_codon:yes gene_type:complete